MKRIKLSRVFAILDERLLRLLPGSSMRSLRLAVLRLAGAKVGKNIVLAQGVRIIGASCLEIEDDVSIARDVVLDARGGLTLQRGALIGFESIILTSTHNSEQAGVPVHVQGMFSREVVIGEYSWLGARCVVQPGVTIGSNVIVGSSAVVTSDLSSQGVFAGVPARFLRNR
ncbi:hypothetical protein R5O87_10580 [Arthrobacter globiformis]|uniref:acyltransferase n=1 Tax=Arthrobacter globiformis TaxID=1665 RepID=UPI00397842DB